MLTYLFTGLIIAGMALYLDENRDRPGTVYALIVVSFLWPIVIGITITKKLKEHS